MYKINLVRYWLDVSSWVTVEFSDLEGLGMRGWWCAWIKSSIYRNVYWWCFRKPFVRARETFSAHISSLKGKKCETIEPTSQQSLFKISEQNLVCDDCLLIIKIILAFNFKKFIMKMTKQGIGLLARQPEVMFAFCLLN